MVRPTVSWMVGQSVGWSVSVSVIFSCNFLKLIYVKAEYAKEKIEWTPIHFADNQVA